MTFGFLEQEVRFEIVASLVEAYLLMKGKPELQSVEIANEMKFLGISKYQVTKFLKDLEKNKRVIHKNDFYSVTENAKEYVDHPNFKELTFIQLALDSKHISSPHQKLKDQN